ncbi:hypothetical protein BVY04_05155 [bacterium M21]|nr:hypothetical protein BVY04_05155 [bacterium M21]
MGLKTAIEIVDKVLGTEVGEGIQKKAEKPAGKLILAESETFVKAVVIGIVIAFFILVSARFLSDLRASECRLLDLCAQLPLSQFLVNHSPDNPHFLYSALLWLWVYIFQGTTEAFYRLPNVVLGFLTLYLLYDCGKRIFGTRLVGMLLVLVGAFSPVYLNFVYQQHGYALAILLAIIATAGAFRIVQDERGLGICLFACGTLLLPMVMAVGLIVNVALLLYLLMHFAQQKRLMMNGLFLGFLVLVAVAGGVIYLPFSHQALSVFTVLSDSRNHLADSIDMLLSVAAHSLPLALAIRVMNSVKNQEARKSEGAIDERVIGSLPFLFIACMVPGLLVAFTGILPFLDLVVLFGPLTFVALMGFRMTTLNENWRLLVMFFLVLVSFLLWTRGTKEMIAKSRTQGIHMNGMLCQTNSDSRDVSTTAAAVLYNPHLPPNSQIFVDTRYYPTWLRSWTRLGGKRDRIEELGAKKMTLRLEKEHYRYIPKFAVGYDGRRLAKQLSDTLGMPIALQPLQSPSVLGIYAVVIPGRGPKLGPTPPALPLKPEVKPISHQLGDAQ